MKKTLLTAALFVALGAAAQEYEWQWAKRGGGTIQLNNELPLAHNFDSERILDIAVDADNNYYYLAFIGMNNTEYDGTPIPVYNALNSMFSTTSPDILLISTNCEGNLRWTQTIGGGVQDYAYTIGLDDNGGLYIGANVFNYSNSGDYLPPHFTPTDAMPALDPASGEPLEGLKTSALLKYNTADGSLAWRVMPQGDVTQQTRNSNIHNLHVTPDGTIHALMVFSPGTHLGGEITVPDTEGIDYKMYLVKYNADGQLLSALELPAEGGYSDIYTKFRYDPALDRYYLSGNLNQGSNTEMIPLSYNGIPFTQPAFILAFSSNGQEVWRKQMATEEPLFYDNRITAFEIDADSDIYLTGKFLVNDDPVTFDDYQLPLNVVGNINFTMKLNPDGEVQWLSVPTSYTEIFNPLMWSGSHFSYDIAIRGNEIAVATQASDEVWGTVTADRPQGYLSEPALLRLNKETGEPIAIHDIWTSQGFRDGLSAVAVDNDGNYIVGGYFYKDLFIQDNDNVPTVTKVNNTQQFTDFFMAKLAATECGTLVKDSFGYKNTIDVYPNPTTGRVNIAAQEKINSYRVINMLGQVLQQGELNSDNSLCIEKLGEGTYLLQLETAAGKVQSNKIVKR